MDWDKLFQWYLKQGLKREESSDIKESVRVNLRPDLKEIKVSYNMRGYLHLADVKPTGLLIQSRA